VFTARGLTKDALPRRVDWRGKGEDGVVKDQATCGSCWVRGHLLGLIMPMMPGLAGFKRADG